MYKSLGSHDPHSTEIISECGKLYDLHPAWRICSPTPDALHVCATYPWASYYLVFADGSACWTALGPTVLSKYKPGTEVETLLPKDKLRQEGGRYGGGGSGAGRFAARARRTVCPRRRQAPVPQLLPLDLGVRSALRCSRVSRRRPGPR